MFDVTTVIIMHSYSIFRYWRQVAVRCYGTGESMAVVMIHPQSLSQEELSIEKKRLVDFFTAGPGTQRRPTSLYFHTFARKSVAMQCVDAAILYLCEFKFNIPLPVEQRSRHWI